MPDWLDDQAYAAAVARVAAKGRAPRLPDLRFAPLAEGRCLQTLHLGPFDDEAPLIARMHDHIAETGHSLGGRHHEIYLSDLRRTAPEKLRTILRQPVDLS
ncbi:GyrI-like domain-containing protein [Nocardioides massiliensis]|uniref:GyrI-like small molecule binding domain-containing protein n=1 Tax=Nocardioides massiliensis TaxID=1325935 RepID=A0ABT9NU96_9ACTN|nr:GyrI-like domain-containing protein [Nocardioides massiliensis]MDP9824001.1 hypothetical protein [Nocardioides massiliensis]